MDEYKYDTPDLQRAVDMFVAVFGEAYGGYLSRQVHEGALGINRFIMCHFAPMVWERDGLDLRTRLLVAIGSLQTLGRDEVKFFMRGAFCNGISRAEIEEVLILVGLEAGMASAMRAGRYLDDAEAEHNVFMAEYEAEQAAKAAKV